MNRVFLMGNLTREPALRRTPTGIAVSDLGVAVSEKYRNKAGEVVESVCFADVVAWGRLAEICGQYLMKGAPVMIEGRLQLDQWQTEAGEKRSRLRVRADRVQFLGKAKGGRDSAAVPEPADGASGIEHEPEERGNGSSRMPF
jgi:single-strand DNA-binding protein